MLRMTRCIVRSALTLSLLACCGVIVMADPAPRPRESRAPAPGVNVTVPDTMRVSVQGAVQVNSRVRDPITVKLDGGKMPADSSPWWRSNVLVAFGSALIGALIGGFIGFAAQLATANLAIGRTHRNALVRMERLSTNHLNDIISNTKLADKAKKAAEQGGLCWTFPHPMDMDPSFLMEVFDLDLVNRVGMLNTDITRYNRSLEGLLRAHFSLQEALLANNLPENAWQQAMLKEAPSWDTLKTHLDALDGMVRDICVRSRLLVQQYDGKKAVRRRLYGLGKIRGWPLDEGNIAEERRRFDADRETKLEAHRKVLAERHEPRRD